MLEKGHIPPSPTSRLTQIAAEGDELQLQRGQAGQAAEAGPHLDPVLLPPQVRSADQVASAEIILPRRGGKVGGDAAQLVDGHLVHKHQELLLRTHERREWAGGGGGVLLSCMTVVV